MPVPFYLIKIVKISSFCTRVFLFWNWFILPNKVLKNSLLSIYFWAFDEAKFGPCIVQYVFVILFYFQESEGTTVSPQLLYYNTHTSYLLTTSPYRQDKKYNHNFVACMKPALLCTGAFYYYSVDSCLFIVKISFISTLTHQCNILRMNGASFLSKWENIYT